MTQVMNSLPKSAEFSLGFTLIEVLIVLLIISIVTGMAVLSIRPNEHQQIDRFGKTFLNQLELAEEEALLRTVVLGVTLREHDYQFMQWVLGQHGKKGHWEALNHPLLNEVFIPRGLKLQLQMNRREKSSNRTNQPQIVISTNGNMTPFDLAVGKSGRKPRFVIHGRENGELTGDVIN